MFHYFEKYKIPRDAYWFKVTSMQKIKRNWNLYNLRLVNRGRPSNYLLPAVENRENDLKVMNKGKVGRPYQYSNVEIFAAYAIKCIFKLGYREASGIVEDYERQYGADNTPNFRTIHWRIKKLKKRHNIAFDTRRKQRHGGYRSSYRLDRDKK